MAKKDEKLMKIEREDVELDGGVKCFAYKVMVTDNLKDDWEEIFKTIGKYERVPYPPFDIALINEELLRVVKYATSMGYKLVI